MCVLPNVARDGSTACDGCAPCDGGERAWRCDLSAARHLGYVRPCATASTIDIDENCRRPTGTTTMMACLGGAAPTTSAAMFLRTADTDGQLHSPSNVGHAFVAAGPYVYLSKRGALDAGNGFRKTPDDAVTLTHREGKAGVQPVVQQRGWPLVIFGLALAATSLPPTIQSSTALSSRTRDIGATSAHGGRPLAALARGG